MTSTPIGFTSMALDVWYRKIASKNQGFVHLYFPLSRLQSLGTQRDVDFLNVFFWNVHQRRAARPKPDLAQVDADWGQALGSGWGADASKVAVRSSRAWHQFWPKFGFGVSMRYC